MGKELISCRKTLYWLLFTGWVVKFMLKMTLNLAIVSMVVPRIKEPIQAQCSTYVKDEEFNDNHHINAIFINKTSNFTEYGIETTPVTLLSNITYDGRFNWTEYEQGLALGSLFWLYCFTNFLGGILMNYYGTKKVFGASILVSSILMFFNPVAIRFHFYAFIALRVVQGMALGFGMPSMNIAAKWIPPFEISSFYSSYMGGTVGTAVSYLITGAVIDNYGWEVAFYIPSIGGIIWCCFWAYYAYDSPYKHPRISKSEMDYITKCITNTSGCRNKPKIPWFDILTSKPFWAAIIACWGSTWAFWAFIIEAPTYFSFIHGWDISMTGILSGLPYILQMLFSYLFGELCDWLMKTNKMSRTVLRKFAVLSCYGIQSICLIGLSLSGCHSNFAIIFMILGTMMSGGITAGAMINLIDLSPNYSCLLLGITAFVSNTSGALVPLIVGILTNENQTIGQWRLVFLIVAGCLFSSGIIYAVWGTGEEQPWNNYQVDNNDRRAEEMERLDSEEKSIMTVDVNRKAEGAQREMEKILLEEKDVKVQN